ncbi:BspA family leucine-rich repeat surface protein [Aquisediminimonas sediminicola]|uniref:BspA family leucine-rich repeat surface protein n=1 Tax=Alteraquisediminimonas sediminicola TaxID=2676787 RepID=UPI001C8D303F|nr:BspA family leucine-rich repeat surface protein [Aquisediminimonas sediminicola]
MSIRTLQSSALGPRHSVVAGRSGGNPFAAPAPILPWVRNPAWAALPVVGNAEEKFVGVHAVWKDGNFLALSATGNYRVDWGDGVIETFASGVQANHQYNYASATLTDSPITFSAAGSTVNRADHGYANGQTISFAVITTTTGIVAGQVYYVVNASANSFQVAATLDGPALALTGDGSGTILPYKTAIVVVTPQAGQVLTSVNLNLKHNQTGLQAGYSSAWLDLLISGPNLTSLQIAGNAAGLNVKHHFLEQAQLISTNNIASMAYLFNDCLKLQSVPIWIASATALLNTANMFQNCYSLQTVPLFSTNAVTNMSAMFANCLSLQNVPMFNTSAATNMSTMFQNCYNIQAVPLINTVLVTNMSAMFQSCVSLQSVPLFNTQAVTNMSTMFQACASLQTVPLLNTAAVTMMTAMFYGCSSLQIVPPLNTQAVTNMSTMFQNCSNLQIVPPFNMASLAVATFMFQNCFNLETVPLFNLKTIGTVDLSYMFYGCTSLQTVPLFNTQAVTNMGNMFQGCVSLQAVPALNCATATSLANMFAGCVSLVSIKLINVKVTISVASCKLSAAALDEIYTNLPTVTGQTITVSGNWGATGDTPSIATAKGWTVTG